VRAGHATACSDEGDLRDRGQWGVGRGGSVGPFYGGECRSMEIMGERERMREREKIERERERER
jgi:hypothetical protein